VDEKHLMRFQGENNVSKFLRRSEDGALNTGNYLSSGQFPHIPPCFITDRCKGVIECPWTSLLRKSLTQSIWELRLHSKAQGKVGHLNSLSLVNMWHTRKKDISKLTFISSMSSPSTTPPANDSFSGFQMTKIQLNAVYSLVLNMVCNIEEIKLFYTVP